MSHDLESAGSSHNGGIDSPPTGGESGHWTPEWSTAIGNGHPVDKLVCGYRLTDLVGRITYADALYLTLRLELPDEEESRLFNACLTAIVDHGFHNTAATTSRFAASANPDPIPAIVAGIVAIGANTAGAQRYVCELIEQGIKPHIEGEASLEEAAVLTVRRHRELERRLPGLGSKTHVAGAVDPRAERLRTFASECGYAEHPSIRFFDLVHQSFNSMSSQVLVMNVDGAMGAVLHALGFTSNQVAAIEVAVMLPSLAGHALEEISSRRPMRQLADENTAYVGRDAREVPRRFFD